MKPHYLICFLIFTRFVISAQTPNWQWVQSGGGSGFLGSSSTYPDPDKIHATAIDHEGNLIVGGETTWNPVFDTTHFVNVNWDNRNFFLAKYDPCGNLLWVRVGGGDGTDYIAGLDIDQHDNIYVYATMQATGNPGYINTPAKDTVLTTCQDFFGKFDHNGNLSYIKTFNAPATNPFYPERGMFKRMKSGNFLSVTSTSAPSGSNIDGYTLRPYSRNFVLFDSLGNVVKVSMIDTIGISNSLLGKFVLDDNDNIYFAISNFNLSSVSFLSHVFNPAQVATGYFIKTDTSFIIKNYKLCYRQEAIFYLAYSNNFLYGVGRNTNGAVFDGDTTFTSLIAGKFTAYKIDTNLAKIWVSRPNVQTTSPAYTLIVPGASKDHVYVGYQNRGNVTWGSYSLNTPSNTADMAIFTLNAATGACESGQITGGTNSTKDEIQFIQVDRQGNAHIIGNFSNSIGTPIDTVFAAGGSSSPDYFILKWGLSCSDTLNSLDRPDAPANLLATGTGQHSINVTWQNTSPYRLGYNLYRSPDGIGNWVQITSTAQNVHFYNDTNVVPSTIYWYKVAAYTTGGESVYSNIDSAQTWSSQCNSPITLNITPVHTICGNNNGSASVNVTAGTGPFSYVWNIGNTSSAISNLTSGTYYITVSSGNCSATASTVVNPSSTNPVTITSDKSVICSGDSAYICAPAGLISYIWNNAQNTRCVYTQLAGSYYVTVTDNSNCTVVSNHLGITMYPVFSVGINNSGDTLIASEGETFQWYLDNNAIPNAISETFIPDLAGSYTVWAADSNGCSVFSTPVIISGLENPAVKDVVKVYPNPLANGSWQLTVGYNFIGCMAEIFDADGRIIFHTPIMDHQSLITLDLARGVYLLRISSAKSSVLRKLIRL